MSTVIPDEEAAMADLTPTTQIDPDKFRQTLGHFPTGVVLVTAIDEDGEPVGMVVGSFTSVSLDPPLVAFLPTRASRTFARLRTATSFCINVLAADQEGLCRRFARPGEDKFAGVEWNPAPSGSPILDGVVAAIDCTFDSILEGGDHYIVIGSVTSLQVVNAITPLLFFQGGYGDFTPRSLVARGDADIISGVQIAERARDELEQIARETQAECSALSPAGNDLVVVAAAVPPTLPARARLGSRVPLIPPLGELYAAFADANDREAWVRGAAPSVDNPMHDEYKRRLALTYRRGWSMSQSSTVDDNDLHDALREYTDGNLTPARLLRIQDVIKTASDYYTPVDLAEEATYDLGTIVVPVLDGAGHAQLILRLSQLPHTATGSQIGGWIEALQASAARISQILEKRTAAPGSGSEALCSTCGTAA